MMKDHSLPKAFIERRGHSLLGLWLVLYIILHLLTNSQAALFVGDDGRGFIHDVNWIHDLPYLPAIEIIGLGFPILFHGWWGIRYALQARSNVRKGDGSTPSLGEYKRNRAYTWQRITSWILIVGLAAHIIHMRFMYYPSHVKIGSQEYFINSLTFDSGLETVAERLDVKLYKSKEQVDFPHQSQEQTESHSVKEQNALQQKQYLSLINTQHLPEGNVIIVAKDFGTATLLMLRETFKSPLMIMLYSLLVITACYHAFNGLWTFCLSWGVIISVRAQRCILRLCQGLMIIVTFLGLAAAWGTYWINLYS